jgi:UDPglucose 6-dehydrogenase
VSIAVIGQGFVGGSLTTVLSERGETVYVYDKAGIFSPGGKNLSKIGERIDSVESMVVACEQQPDFSGIFFVCVPTPMYEDGSADISIVEDVLKRIVAASHISNAQDRIAVVKSTVPPGSTEMWNRKFNAEGLHVVFNPEFLTEANALNDMREQNRIILGGPRPYINSVKNVFQRAFPKVPIIKTSSTTAEMVKYVTNCFLSVKVSFANEVAQICEALDNDGMNIDYDKVVEYARFDRRLGDSHWSVPGPVPTHDGRYVRGFGGHCFPKDINALMDVSKRYNVKPTVMQAAWEKNLEIRGPEDRDWEKQIGRAVSKKQR